MSCRGLLVVLLASACAAPPDELVGLGELEESSSALQNATTVVSLTFDDTFADNFQVAAMAEARGMRATFYVNSGRIGQSGYMTRAQLIAMEDAGHEIAGHTISHANLSTLEPDEVRRQVCNDRLALLDAGFAITSFAYPFSAQSSTVHQIVAECGYNSGRLVGGLAMPSSCNGCPYANRMPPPDAYQVRTNDSVKEQTTLEDLTGYVTRAEQNGGGWVPIVFHHVCAGCDSLAVSPTTLAAFLDWLEARVALGTEVATVDQVIGGTLKAGVDGPPVYSQPATGNMLQNPSLESDSNGDQLPDCWQRGGTGTNAATYSLTNVAYEGNVAQRITMTSFTSGARRLVSRQDLGTCAPAVTPGRQYTVTARYIANSQPMFTIYYRNSSGGWVWFAQSPRLPTSSTYALGIYTTPAMPEGATAISVGLSLAGLGTLTMDAFTLAEAGGTTDATPPVVALTSPADGATVSGTVTLSATASDASGIGRVELLADGTVIATELVSPYELDWDTTPFAGRTVTLTARAFDEAGNTATSASRQVTVAGATSTNLLQNASLETDANGDQIPDCWQRGGSGTNAAIYTLTTNAYAGARAQRIDMTSYSSGARRLVSRQDTGACAPAAAAGRRYTVTARYIATSQPVFTIYYRNASGSWVWFAQSPTFATSSSYALASYTTPALPSSATAISVGLSILNLGSLTMDDFTLVQAP
ncbi:MAG: polysaccharide deacetylase family protein [Deltaproteobacteria bacterium]|nr:polysaccharide deacetylase family protein [Deltaproteobacteria bacterium]MDQ3297595.1 polysaccharide deacetylase family protein [Myxococcota bacterium]